MIVLYFNHLLQINNSALLDLNKPILIIVREGILLMINIEQDTSLVIVAFKIRLVGFILIEGLKLPREAKILD